MLQFPHRVSLRGIPTYMRLRGPKSYRWRVLGSWAMPLVGARDNVRRARQLVRSLLASVDTATQTQIRSTWGREGTVVGLRGLLGKTSPAAVSSEGWLVVLGF